jgi:hypothetical protein
MSIEYDGVFWRDRAGKLCEEKLALSKENRRLSKENKELKSAMVIVNAIKSIVSKD